MVDQKLVKSGFDMEILLGKGFFGEALLALRDAKLFPTSIRIADKLSIEIESFPELIFSADLKVGLKFSVIIHVGDKQYAFGETDILFNFEFVPVRQDAGYVSDVRLKISFDEINNTSLDFFLSTMGDIPIDFSIPGMPSTLAELKDEMIKQMSKMLRFEYRTNLVTRRVQDVQVRMLENPSALGVYLNFIMRKEPGPDSVYPNRGDINNANNLLRESTNIGIFSPGTVYPMLTSEMKTTMAKETSPGKYEYPIFRKDFGHAEAVGKLKAFVITSAERLASNLFFNIKDPEQLLIRINTRISIESIDADADAWMTFRPKIVDGCLAWDVTNLQTNIDVDWDDKLKIAFVGGIFLGIFTGFAALPVVTALLYAVQAIAEEIAEGYVEDYISGLLADKMDNLLGSIPDAITVAHKREDPFYETHYQVAGKFEFAKTNKDGMAFLADTGHREIYVPYNDVALKEAVRDADNNLTGLIYKVPKADEILNPEKFTRPDPEKKDEFLLTLDEIEERFRSKKIRKKLFYVTPTHVIKSQRQIKYIKFDNGIYLTPDEAGDLQQKGILGVTGLFKRIYMKQKKKFYYRAKTDRYTSNNLASLPTFEIPSTK